MTHNIFTPADAAIILVDHQPGVVAMIQSVPIRHVVANSATLAKLANDLGLPHVLTTTREGIDRLGTTIEAIQKAAPLAYANRVRRPGTLNAFHDPAFVDAVKNLGRPNLIIAGVLTDVCLSNTVFSALEAGYRVQVVADASGTTSILADDVTYDRLRAAGAVVTTTWGALFELYNDLSTPEGQKAEAAAGNAIVIDVGTLSAMAGSKVFA